jgi:hypothetical protein
MDWIVSPDFRREEFQRIFDSYEYEQSMQILGFVNYLGITGQLDLSENFTLFADVETLEQAINKWNDYRGSMNTSPAQ